MTTSTPAPAATNPYLTGVLGPVAAEVEATDLRVTGELPAHLDGRYLRNGPNPAGPVDPARYHWFAGDAMVHGLALRDGRALWYRNRWVRTAAVARTLGEPRPPLDPGAGMLSVAPNTNVIEHAGQTLALVEGGGANYRLSEDLGTLGTCDFDGTLRGGYTAHPHRDPHTGELHAVSYSFARGTNVTYSVIDAAGRLRRSVDIPVHGFPMMHDFTLTEKYVVIYDLPVTFDPAGAIPDSVPRLVRPAARALISRLAGRVRVPGPIAARIAADTTALQSLPFAWNPDYPARVGVLPRDGEADDIRWFDVDPCFVFHPVNGFSEQRDGQEVLVLDVIRYERMFDRDRRGPSEGEARLDRWEINLSTGRVTGQTRDDRPQEFPRINESRTGRPHRFGYTVGIDGLFAGTADLRGSVFKQDFHTGGTVAARLEPGVAVGELCFVPTPGGTAEDDGVLMGFGWHRDRDEGRLLVLDAGTLETVATVHLPQRVPLGFHGNWCPRATAV